MCIRKDNGTSATIASQEGVTQGDPLAMIGYGLLVLPLIRRLKKEIEEIKQVWHADDSSGAGRFAAIKKFYALLEKYGPSYGYFPEASKSILTVPEGSIDLAKAMFREEKFKMRTGARYLGSYVGSKKDQDEWLLTKVDDWTAATKTLAKAAEHFPQTANIGMTKSLLMELQCAQRVLDDIGDQFQPMEDAITSTCLPSLFGIKDIKEEEHIRKLAALPVKFSGLAILDPTTTAKDNHNASTLITAETVSALRGNKTFNSVDHQNCMATCKGEMRTRKLERHEQQLNDILDFSSLAPRREQSHPPWP